METESNSTSYDILLDLEENQRLWLKYGIAFSGILVEIISLALSCSVIYFEKFGGDAQKRTILNQLLSSLCILVIWLSLFPLNVFLLRILSWPLPQSFVKVSFFMPKAFAGFVGMMILNEMIVIRYFSVFVWKRVPPINENIFALAIVIINVCVSGVLTLYANMGFNIEQKLNLLLCGIQDQNLEKKPVFSLYFYTLIVTAIIHLSLGSRLACKKIREKILLGKAVLPVVISQMTLANAGRPRSQALPPRSPRRPNKVQIRPSSAPPNVLQLNTISRNKDMFSLIVNILLTLCLILMFVTIFVSRNLQNNAVVIVMTFFMPHVFVSMVVPGVICSVNPKVLPFVYGELKNHF